MSFYLLIPALAFLFNLALVPVVLEGRYRSYLHRIFSGFLLTMALWGGTIFLMRSSANQEEAFFW